MHTRIRILETHLFTEKTLRSKLKVKVKTIFTTKGTKNAKLQNIDKHFFTMKDMKIVKKIK